MGRSRTSWCWLFGLFAVVFGGVLADAAAVRANPSGLFDTVEFRGAPLPPWRGFVAGLKEADAAFDRCAAGRGCALATIRAFTAELDALASEPRRMQVE